MTPVVNRDLQTTATGKSRWLSSYGGASVLALILSVGLFSSPAAQAVLLATEDGTENTENQFFAGWDYVGEVNGLSATYLGRGWVLTASHVGPGDLLLNGNLYPWIPGTEIQLRTNESTLGDLVIFGLDSPYPGMPPLILPSAPPTVGDDLIMIGCGLNRGTETSWDPNGPSPPEELQGWNWGSGSAKRWGTNKVASLTSGLINNTVSFYTSFDEGQPNAEAQAAAGDSGGAVFLDTPGGLELTGIIYAAGPTPGQPAGTALYTNLTFVARMDWYEEEISGITKILAPLTVPLSPLLWPLLVSALGATGAWSAFRKTRAGHP